MWRGIAKHDSKVPSLNHKDLPYPCYTVLNETDVSNRKKRP